MEKSKALMYQVIKGSPDWAKVKKAGINFAILRIHQKNGPDTSFEHNYKGCRARLLWVDTNTVMLEQKRRH